MCFAVTKFLLGRRRRRRQKVTALAYASEEAKQKIEKKNQILVIFPIIMHVIPNVRPFRTISYGFQDKHFF